MRSTPGETLTAAETAPRVWRRRWFRVTFALAAGVILACVCGVEYVLHNAEPILRRRIIETLSARFDAPVELDELSISLFRSLFRGIQVEGRGLRIPYDGFAGSPATGLPPKLLLNVQYFAFRTSVRGLLHQPTDVRSVAVDGMELHIPPPGERARLLGPREGHGRADPQDPRLQPKIAITVRELQCRDVKLFLDSSKSEPDGRPKAPLEFDIQSLALQHVGAGQAMLYDAQLTNPKPVGAIHASGHFGPWAGGPAAMGGGVAAMGGGPDPGATPVDGDYRFDHADLNSIKGIGGTLSSAGHFAGVLDRITIDGQTDTPDFSLDISNRPVPLHTQFHAVVDGTSGDTYLEPVHARLEGSEFTVTGEVVKVGGPGRVKGHEIQLDVNIPRGRMQDFLRLAVRTNPPLMNGVLGMRAQLHIPPGDRRVAEKMSMEGTFHLADVRFNNGKLQDRIDGLSARAQGRPREVAEVSRDHEAEVRSAMDARFTLGGGVMTVSDVRYGIPGALVLLNGVYSMDGKLFEFKGHVRTDATASQMVTGWKSLLLKPVDHFLKKDGAGLELPIEISGTEGDLHLGLALHGTDDTPAEMLADVRGKQRAEAEVSSARREAALADAEDLKAAQASTLEEAERAHNAAVRHRAEAQRQATQAQTAGGPKP